LQSGLALHLNSSYMWEPPAVSTVIVSFDPSTLLDKLFLAHCKTVHDRLSIDFIYFTAKVSQLHHVNIRARHAALILADDGVDITADNLKKLTTAANIDKVDAIFPVLHAQAFERKDVKGPWQRLMQAMGPISIQLHVCTQMMILKNACADFRSPLEVQDKCSAAQCLLATGGNNSPSATDLKVCLPPTTE
jgi:hypothetical protein